MPFQIGDRIRLVETPTTEGEVTRLNIMKSTGSVAVLFDNGNRKAYFGANVSKIEKIE